MYAIIETGGKQHRVEPGQHLWVERLAAEVGASVRFDRVLLVRGAPDEKCRIGAPYLDGASVSGSVVSQDRAPKVLVLKRKRRKGYRVKQGHRQARTGVRIEAIDFA